MKLIVGLGNIGRKYENTRHNVGFNVLDLVAERNAGGSSKEKFEGRTQEVTIGGERALLLWPHTLMNLSGQSVEAALAFYQLQLGDVLVVCDDFNLPLGKLRFRSQGSAGGQKGLARHYQSARFGRIQPVANRHRPGARRMGRGRLCAGTIRTIRPHDNRRSHRPRRRSGRMLDDTKASPTAMNRFN